MGMFFSLSLPWWVFPQPDFMLVRGGHRLAFCSLCVAAGARPESRGRETPRLGQGRVHEPGEGHMPHTALAGRSGCVQQEPAEDLCGGHPQEGRGIARLSVRTGASGQRRVEKNRARVAERGRDRAQPKKGDATLENATAAGRKLGVLGLQV